MTFSGGSHSCMYVFPYPHLDSYSYLLYSGFKFSQLEMSTSSRLGLVSGIILTNWIRCSVTEVILAILMQSFRFKPSNKPVVWNYSNIVFPTVVGNDSAVSLPLTVEIV